MPPKGFVSITVTQEQYARLNRMKKARRLASVAACIDELLALTGW